MIDLNMRIINDNGEVKVNGDYLYELIYQGKGFNYDVLNSSDIEKFNEAMERNVLFAHTITTQEIDDESISHENRQKEWNMPFEYTSLDVEAFLLEKASNAKELERIRLELELFKSIEAYDWLRFLIYLVDFTKENELVIGVGRGSSVASYCLYLMGIHKINSLLYNLDPYEFFKKIEDK